MTEITLSKLSPIDDLKALKGKQWLGIVLAFILSAAIVVSGLVTGFCGLGYLLVAVVLYMIPHMLGVSSVKVKSLIGVIFVVFLVLFAAFGCNGAIRDMEIHSVNNGDLKDTHYEDGILTITTEKELTFSDACEYREITHVPFGNIADFTVNNPPTKITFTKTSTGYQAQIDLKHGCFYHIYVKLDNGEYCRLFVDNGVSNSTASMINLNGSAITIVLVGALFFLLLGLSAYMRKGASKARAKMEAEGRMYPVGYDKCKKCGAMVLPGEINCRKCGTPIEVPEELKVLHKKDFFECSECGTEVPIDATYCPKCGARFDEETENVIKHVDGTIDSSVETFECSECGKVVPANAKRCPYCGAAFDEDEEPKKN